MNVNKFTRLNFYKEKFEHIKALRKETLTPLPLILDSLNLKTGRYDAALLDNTKLRLKGGVGEWFTFLEVLLRRDYLQYGIRLNKGDVAIDIGANIGAFTVLAAGIVGDTGHVYAYEPDPEVFERLKENIALNMLTNVTAVNEAISGTTGQGELALHDKSAYNSITESTDGRDNANADHVTISLRGIEDAINGVKEGRVDLIKMDCEGAEYDILQHLSKETASKIRQISMELHVVDGHDPAEITQNLTRTGFRYREGYPLTAFLIEE